MGSVVRVQTLFGIWETLGVERFSGITPEQIRPAADQMGPSTLAFQIQRDTGLVHPDLSAWTPCEVENDGIVIWDGRIKETPSQEGTQQLITVNGLGWQSHLDDDALERYYVHQDLTAWQDGRSINGASLTALVSSPTVTQGNGQIVLAFPAGTPAANASWCVACLDLGPLNIASSAYIDVSFTNPAAAFLLYIRSSNAPPGHDTSTTAADAINSYPSTAGNANGLGGDFLLNTSSGLNAVSLAGRYVYIIFYNSGAAVTPTLDITATITRALVSCNSDIYATGRGVGAAGSTGNGQSDLRASDVITDKVQRCAPLITVTPRSPAMADEVLADQPLSYFRLGNNVNPPSAATLTSGDPHTADLGSLNVPLTSLGSVISNQFTTGLLVDDADVGMRFNATTFAAMGTPANYTPVRTIEATVRVDALPGTAQDIIWLNGFVLRINTSSQFEMVMTTGGGTATNAATGLTAVVGGIYHVVATYDQSIHTATSGVTMRINGVAMSLSGAASTGALIAVTAGSIGANSNGSAELFNGIIDEVALYDYPLSATQATNHYRAARARSYGGVQRTQFKVPSYAAAGSKTPHEDITSLNALHNWRIKVPVGRSLLFQPQPTTSLLRVSDSVPFSDAGANDGQVIYNKVIVEGADATGQPVRTTIHAADIVAGAGVPLPVGTQPWNADFELPFPPSTGSINPNGWTLSSGGGSFVQDTNPPNALNGTASLQGTIGAIPLRFSAYLAYGLLPPVKAGILYRYSIWIRANYSGGTATVAIANDANTTAAVTSAAVALTNGTYVNLIVDWIPTANHAVPAFSLNVQASSGTPTVNVDKLQVLQGPPTIVDRRGFSRAQRLTANSPIDQPTAALLANAFLQANIYSPFRGSFIASSPNDVHLLPGDTPVNPGELMLHTGELIRIPRIDPDTGDLGRDGKIVTVAYDDDADQATVTIDDDRNNLQALMSRLAVVQSAGGV